ncbi:MAG: pyridoxamine 5'-phosphate oxidase family protein [Ilumatobacter sp.]
MPNRTVAERTAHARTRLSSDHNVWISTASSAGIPHLVPLSLAWLDGTIVVATPSTTPTARNATTTGRARAALDSADDVVIFDADVETHEFNDAPAALIDGYIERVGWDHRDNPGQWSLLVLRPRTGHVWNGPAEIDGRTIIRQGHWVED